MQGRTKPWPKRKGRLERGGGARGLPASPRVCSEGRAERVREVRCTGAASPPPLTAQIAFWDQGGQPLGARGKRLPSLSLTFRSGAPDHKAEKHTGKVIG